MKKISFICAAGLDNFIDPIIEGLASEYTVRKFVVRSKQDIFNAIDYGQIIFCEWCNEIAIIATNYEGIKGKKVIVRLHSYEIFTDFPKQINWDVVDKLIFVAPHIREILNELIPDIKDKVKTEIIYNGVDIDSIRWKERQPGYNIAWVGFINYKKNPPMALQIMNELVNTCNKYKLHIAGSYQDLRYKIYLEYMIKEMGLQDNVVFYGWVNDMEGFWKDKNYLLHTSIHEGHSYAINESLVRGIKPVIHNFRGAKELYPKYAIFNTIEGAVNIITNKNYYPRAYMNWVIDKGWTLDKQVKQIEEVIDGI